MTTIRLPSNGTDDAFTNGRLTVVPGVDPAEAARALVSLRDEAPVKAVMNRLDPGDAARIVASAPGIQAQTRLIWSLEKPQRAAVVDHLRPTALAALIQNQERRNRRLLGDMSLEHFSRILEFCSPKQRYYWMSLANSFPDIGANLLVLLLPVEQVAEALLTVPEFRRKVKRLRHWVPGGFDESPPVDDPRLRAVLTRLSQFDSSRCTEVMDAALAAVEESAAISEIVQEIESDPVVLPQIPEVPPLVAAAAGTCVSQAAESGEEEGELQRFLLMPLPSAGDALTQAAIGMLTPARRAALEQEMERAFRDEVMADGGSLAMQDLERAAARLQAYLRLGLQGVPEQPERVAEVLEKVPLRDITHRGTVALEQLRQIVLRLRPFEALLDRRQRDLVQALYHPCPTVETQSGAPALQVPSTDRRRRPETIPIAQIHERLAEVSIWVAVARAIGLRALSEKLASAPNGSLAVLAALAASLLLHERWDPRALESRALREFSASHFDREHGRWAPGTVERIRQASEAWAAAARIEAAMRPRVVGRILEAMNHLEEFLRTHRTVAWEQFAPGRRARQRRVAVEDGEEEMEEES